MPKLLIDELELPEETLQIIGLKPGAMPIGEFISFLVQFGAARFRDAYQQERLDYVAQTMNRRMMEYHQRDNDLFATRNEPAPEVVSLIKKPKSAL